MSLWAVILIALVVFCAGFWVGAHCTAEAFVKAGIVHKGNVAASIKSLRAL